MTKKIQEKVKLLREELIKVEQMYQQIMGAIIVLEGMLKEEKEGKKKK